MIPTISNNDDSSASSHESTVDGISGTSKHELPAACTVCSCTTPSSQVDKRMTRLPNTFMPGNFDVICAKGSNARNHMGNRQNIKEHAEAYGVADSKVVKAMVVSSVVDWIRRLSPDGGFVYKSMAPPAMKLENSSRGRKLDKVFARRATISTSLVQRPSVAVGGPERKKPSEMANKK